MNSAGPPKAAIKVTLAGSDLTDKIAPRLLSLRLAEKRGGEADQLDIEIHDHDGALAIPPEGAELTLSIGWERPPPGGKAGLVDKGKFKVDEAGWSGPPDKITIRARSADFTGQFRTRREKKWKDTTLGAVLQDIAGNLGVKANVDASLASIAVLVLAQDNRSDAQMLRFLGRRHDAVATVKSGTLLFAPIGKGATTSGKALPSFTIERRSGDSYSWSRAAREDYGGVEARYHDQDKAKRETVTAGGGGKGTPKRLRRTFHSKAEAQAAVDAEHKRVQRAAASFEVNLAYGDAGLYPEQKGKVSGFKPTIDGEKWIAAELEHQLDGAGGFRTRLKLEKDA